jgi:hypothetical protein
MENDEESKKNAKIEKREDKIFNNRYNQGDGLKDPDEYEYNKNIKVESSYSSNYLNDLYDYENNLEYKIFLEHIFEIIRENKELDDLINEKDGTRNKFNKEEVNFIFDKVSSLLEKETGYETFSSSIYVLEAISSITGMEYKKIFDFLDYSHREVLLSELNKKYKFLDWKMNKNSKLF